MWRAGAECVTAPRGGQPGIVGLKMAAVVLFSRPTRSCFWLVACSMVTAKEGNCGGARFQGLARLWRVLAGNLRMAERDTQEMDEDLKSIMDHSPDAIARFDLNFRHLYVTPSLATQTGIPTSNFIGRTHEEIGFPDALCRLTRESLQKTVDAGEPRRVEFELPNGIWVDWHLVPEFGRGGEVQSVLAYAREITDRKQAEKSLREQFALHQALLKAQSDVGEGVLTIEGGRVTFVNEALCRNFGYSAGEVMALASFVELVHPDDRARVMENHRRRLAGEQFEHRYEISILTRDGERREVEIAVAPIPKGDNLSIVVVVLDITSRKRAEELIQHMALHDTLTGLANRVLLKDHLKQAIAMADRHQGKIGLLFLDLDNFKPVNDALGHETGDEVLREIARRVRTAVRETDMVARFGGDEFVVLLPQLPDTRDASVVARKIIAEVRRQVVVRGGECIVGVSIGVAVYPDDAKDIDALLVKADNAMYLAKGKGGNRCRFFATAT